MNTHSRQHITKQRNACDDGCHDNCSRQLIVSYFEFDLVTSSTYRYN